MIDHVSIAVRDLDRPARFYQGVLVAIGYEKLVVRPRTIGFGKAYPEFWLNLRATMAPVEADGGAHVALRVRTIELVDAFHAAAIAAGGTSDGAPGLRPQHGEGYYAAFICDPDGNRIEAVTFFKAQEERPPRLHSPVGVPRRFCFCFPDEARGLPQLWSKLPHA